VRFMNHRTTTITTDITRNQNQIARNVVVFMPGMKVAKGPNVRPYEILLWSTRITRSTITIVDNEDGRSLKNFFISDRYRPSSMPL
jgi:hypothetical protein